MDVGGNSMSIGYQLQTRDTSSLTDIAQLPVELVDTGAGGVTL